MQLLMVNSNIVRLLSQPRLTQSEVTQWGDITGKRFESGCATLRFTYATLTILSCGNADPYWFKRDSLHKSADIIASRQSTDLINVTVMLKYTNFKSYCFTCSLAFMHSIMASSNAIIPGNVAVPGSIHSSAAVLILFRCRSPTPAQISLNSPFFKFHDNFLYPYFTTTMY